MFMNADSAETLECHSAKINVGNKLKLMLLAKREIEWKVDNITDIKQTGPSIHRQKFDFSIEQNGELPNLILRVGLVPGEFYNEDMRNNHYIDVQCCLVGGYRWLSRSRIFYKIDMEVLKEDGSLWRKMSSDTEERQSRGLPDIWKPYQDDDFENEEYVIEYFNLWHNFNPELLPIRSDGSLLFRFTFQFFTKRVVSQLDQEANPEMEMNWLGHFETRAKADKASVDGKKEDVELICCDGKKVKFHKQLLVARGYVFEVMFRSGMKESKSGVVHLDDLTGEAVQLIHHFLYDGRLQPYMNKIRDEENLEELEKWLYIASKYQFVDLLKFFDGIMITLCNEGNAMELLKLSNKFDLRNGRENVKAFIRKYPQLLNNF